VEDAMRQQGDHVERGQVLIMAALGLVCFLGLAALVIDTGQMMVHKQRIQNAADAAALAGILELPASEAAARAMAIEYNGRNGVPVGEIDEITTSSSEIAVYNRRQVNFFVADILGFLNDEVDVVAKARIDIANGFRFDDVNVFPYAVWGGHPKYTIEVGDEVTFFSNQYEKANDIETGNPDWFVTGNNFKGYFKHGGEVVYVGSGEQTFSSGGTTCGDQPIAALEAKMAADEFIILPVISRASGNGFDMQFVIKAWVAVDLTRVNCPQAMRGIVLGNVTSPLGFSNGSTPPTGVPELFASSLVE
jgi:Flp pilus assembly protein TadG